MALLTHRKPAAEPAEPPVAALPFSQRALILAMTEGRTQAERRFAASQLAAAPEAAGELAAALARESDPRVRAAMLAALVAIGTPEAAAGLAALIGSDDAGLRNAACDALRDMGETARTQVEGLLASPDPDLRIVAVGLLETVGSARARERLRAILAREPELNVALAAIETLAQIGGPDDIDALRDCAARFEDEPFASFAVELACRRVAGEDAQAAERRPAPVPLAMTEAMSGDGERGRS